MDTTTVGLIIALAALSVVILAAAIYFTREVPPHKPSAHKQTRAKRASRKQATRKPETEK
jgi:hypothetical protein